MTRVPGLCDRCAVTQLSLALALGPLPARGIVQRCLPTVFLIAGFGGGSAGRILEPTTASLGR